MNFRSVSYLIAAILLLITGIGSLIFLSFSIVLQSIGAAGSWTLFGVISYYLLTSVPTFQGAGAWIARGLSFWKTAEKSAVALRIQKSLNATQEEINSESKGLFPYPAKVEWIDKPSYLNTDEECVIIRMREHEENPRNVAYAVVDYVTNGLIPYSRLYIKKPIRTAIDSTMVKKILLEKDKGALDYFLTNVLSKVIGEKGVQHYMNVINSIDEHGLFTRVYLEEIKEIGLKLYPTSNQEAITETREYLVHLNILATRKQGELDKAKPFIGKTIKVAYVLIADLGKLMYEGHKPYIQYALRCVEKGAENIYLLSRGKKIGAAKNLASEIAVACNLKVINISEHSEFLDDKMINACCIVLKREKAVEEKKKQ
jgi:hypothetical protein